MGGLSVIFLMSILSFIYFLFLSIFVISTIYVIVSYIFESLAITKLSKNKFLSWIPFYNKYLLGKTCNKKLLGVFTEILSLTIFILALIIYLNKEFNTYLLIAMLILLTILFILETIIATKIYEKTIPKYKDILTVLTILSFGLLRPIFLFLVRSNKSKESDYHEI